MTKPAANRIQEDERQTAPASGLRLGLCCQFIAQPIKFRTTTAAGLQRLPRPEQLRRLAELCLANAEALQAALGFCAAYGISSFRILSPILPLRTHPTVGYRVEQLPAADSVVAAFERCGELARQHNIRTGFHPDQFVVLNSPTEEIVARSIADIEAQAEVAEWTNADTVNIHGGGGYGDKAAALERFAKHLERLSERARRRLTLENDDKTFTPADLLPLCRREGVPLVYDAHHHRCCPDELTVEQATTEAFGTWDREPLFHISSPRDGWNRPFPERHHDFIDPRDFPQAWRNLALTVEVEAKAKEKAVLKLREDLRLAAGHSAAIQTSVPLGNKSKSGIKSVSAR